MNRYIVRENAKNLDVLGVVLMILRLFKEFKRKTKEMHLYKTKEMYSLVKKSIMIELRCKRGK